MEKNMIKVLFICHGKVSPMRQRTSIYNGFSHLSRWISHTFPTIMSLWHSTNDFPLTLRRWDFLWEVEVGQKWPGSDFRNSKESSGHFPYSSWENIVDYIRKAFSGYNTVRNLLCNLTLYVLLKCSLLNCK